MASTIQQIETPKCARALDTSGSNNHGQIYSGRALEFDGVTDYFQHNGGTGITGTSLFANGVPWTWACWIYFDSASTSENYFVGNDGQTQPHITFKNSSSDNILRFRDTNADYYTFSTTKLDNNTWYRIVITTDGTSITAYVNGVVYGTIAANQANVAADDNFDNTLMEFSGWGCPYSSGGTRAQHLQGMMSDGQVWDATWTASDVTYDYLNPESLVLSNGDTSLTESNLKIWYPMQDGHRGQQSYILDASNTGLGDELVTNGSFTTDSDWNKNSNWTIDTTGGATAVADGSANTDINQVITSHPVANNIYKVTFDVVSVTAGSVHFLFGGATGTSRDSVGTYSEYITASNTDRLKIDSHASNLFAGSIDNVSVKLVNAKNNATTVFYGDEQITDSKNRDFASASDWVEYSPDGSAPTFGDDGSPAYLEITGLADTDPQGATLAVSNLTTPVVGRTYRIQANIWWDSSNPGIGSVFKIAYAGATSSAFEVTATVATSGRRTVELVATSASGDLIIYYEHANQTKWFIDDVTVKEIGVATGWTDADQQLHIPQTALQSYNELAWFQDKLGNDNPHAEVAHHTDLDPGTTDFTVSCWVCQSDKHDDNYVFQKGGGGASGWNLQVRGDGDIVLAIEDDDGGNNGTRIEVQNTNDVVPIGEWFHLVGTYEYGSATGGNLYLNGELIAGSVDVSSHNNPIRCTSGTTAKLRMGSWSVTYAYGVMNGSATEFSYFIGAAFSPAEVRELYNDGKALDATKHSQVANLKGYWRNDGLNATWKNIHNPGTHDATFLNGAETMLIPQGLDSRDSQGFIMNRQRNTSSLNLGDNCTSYVEVPVKKQADDDLAFIGVGDAFSVSCWVKLLKGTSAAKYIVNRHDGNDGWRLSIDAAEKIEFITEVGGAVKTAITDSAISLDTWYHVVGTFNGDPSDNGSGVMNLYINGVTGSSTTNNITDAIDIAASANLEFTIGKSLSNHFPGEIDGVLIYDDVLTQAEVTRNYNATKGSHRN